MGRRRVGRSRNVGASLFPLLGLVLAAACAPAPAAPPAAPAAPILLAVVSWNLDAGRGDLPRLLTDLAGSRLTGAVPLDYVALLQEAVEADVARLAQARGLHVFYVPVRARGGNAILSTAPLADTRAIPLPRARQPRNAAAAAVTVGGETLIVVSTHLENRVAWWRGGLISDTARGRQAEALLRAIPDNARAIVGGDMNTWLGPAEPAWRLLAQRFPDTPEASTPTFRERLVLDHLFFDLPDRWRAMTRVVAQRYASNHHPVVAAITRGAGVE